MSQLILSTLKDDFDDVKIQHLPTVLYVDTVNIVEILLSKSRGYNISLDSLQKTTVSDTVTLHLENGEKVDYGAGYFRNGHYVSHYRIPSNNWSIVHYSDLNRASSIHCVANMLDQKTFTFRSTGNLALVQYVKVSSLPQTTQDHIRQSFTTTS